jgi:hypothetical protein
MVTVSVQGTQGVVVSLQNEGKAVPRATVRAMNRGLASGRTVMVRAIAQDTGLKSAPVRDALVYREATLSNPEARLAASLKRIPLIDFGARGPEPSRGKGRGVTYRLGGSRNRVENAFIATMPTGHRGVFVRVPGANRRGPKPYRSQLPIRELKGPSLGHVFIKHQQEAVARVIEMFQKNFGHELAYAAGEASAPPNAGAE